ncbi:MAG: thrombospondin type 3 repeat-containing protein [Patescibacteria group bacterium]|jgi:hypothetical protein
MFRIKKTNEKETKEKELIAQIGQNLVVHNMPSPARIIGSYHPSPSLTTGPSLISESKSNFKAVGILIIVGGLIIVAGLVYASYYFIIKPTINKNQPGSMVATKKPTFETVTATTTPTTTPTAIIMATSSTMATVTPNNLDLSTSTDSTTMNEESTGKINQNLPPLVDSDKDGLNDEEEATLGTNAAVADSDIDGYSDLAELNSGYDPLGPGKLKDSSTLAIYNEASGSYQVFYPKNWTVKPLNTGYTVIFTAPDDSIIQISIQDNSDKEGILTWYESSFPGLVVTYDKLESQDSWDGIMGEDNLNFYLTDKKHTNIYVISYIPAVTGRIAYPSIFKTMINSLVVK